MTVFLQVLAWTSGANGHKTNSPSIVVPKPSLAFCARGDAFQSSRSLTLLYTEYIHCIYSRQENSTHHHSRDDGCAKREVGVQKKNYPWAVFAEKANEGKM